MQFHRLACAFCIAAITGAIAGMSKPTFPELIAKVRLQLQDAEGNYWTDEEITDYLNEGQLEYVRKTKALRAEAPIISSQNNDTYNLPQDCLTVLRIEDEKGNEIPRVTSGDLSTRVGEFRNRERTGATATTDIAYTYSDLDGQGGVRFYPRPTSQLLAANSTFEESSAFESDFSLPISGTFIAMDTIWKNGRDYAVVLTSTHVGVFAWYERKRSDGVWQRGFDQYSTWVRPLATAVVDGTPSAITLDPDYSRCNFYLDNQGTLRFWLQDSSNNVLHASAAYSAHKDLLRVTDYSQTVANIEFQFPVNGEGWPATTILNESGRNDPIVMTQGGMVRLKLSDAQAPVALSTVDASYGFYGVQATQSETVVDKLYRRKRVYWAMQNGVEYFDLEASSNYLSSSGTTSIYNDSAGSYGITSIGDKIYYSRGLSGTEIDLWVYDETLGTHTDTGYKGYFGGDPYAIRSGDTANGPFLYDGTYLWILKDADTIQRFTLNSSNLIASVDEFVVPSAVNGTIYRNTFAYSFLGRIFLVDRQNQSDGALANTLFAPINKDRGCIFSGTEIEFDGDEAGFTNEISSNQTDDVVVFDSEYGIVTGIQINTSGLYVIYVKSPTLNTVEVEEPLALIHYALYKCYEKDGDQTAMQKSAMHENKFQKVLTRDTRRVAEGFNGSSTPTKGYYY